MNSYKFIITALWTMLCCVGAAQAETLMPIVKISGTFSAEYSSATFSLISADRLDTVSFTGQIKWRGSQVLYAPKKSYAVKLDENVSLLNMRQDDSWILDGAASDISRCRNRVCTDLWNDFSYNNFIAEQYDYRSMNGTRGEFVLLYLNDTPQGIYCLTEKIDRKQLRLRKMKDGQVRGILYKAQTWNGTKFDNDYDRNYSDTSFRWNGWEAQYPNPSTEDSITDWAPLSDAIRWTNEADTATFCSDFNQKFDERVWIDYFLFTNILFAPDNQGKNMYLYVYDITCDSTLGVAPWDLDATFGRKFNNAVMPYDTIFNDRHYLAFRMLRSYYFKQKMADRYFELRNGCFTADSLKARFSRYFNYFRESGAAAVEYAVWGQNHYNGVVLDTDFRTEEKYIYNWIDKRLPVLDTYYQKMREGYVVYVVDVNGDGVLSMSDITTLVGWLIDGQTHDSGDVNGDGNVTMADVTFLIKLLLRTTDNS